MRPAIDKYEFKNTAELIAHYKAIAARLHPPMKPVKHPSYNPPTKLPSQNESEIRKIIFIVGDYYRFYNNDFLHSKLPAAIYAKHMAMYLAYTSLSNIPAREIARVMGCGDKVVYSAAARIADRRISRVYKDKVEKDLDKILGRLKAQHDGKR